MRLLTIRLFVYLAVLVICCSFVSAACVVLENGVCYTSAVRSGYSYAYNYGDMSVGNPSLPNIVLALEAAGSAHASQVRSLFSGSVSAVDHVEYGKVCQLDLSRSTDKFNCVAPEETTGDNEIKHFCTYSWHLCGAEPGTKSQNCPTWAVTLGRSDWERPYFSSALESADLGSFTLTGVGASGSCAIGGVVTTCEDTDSDGDDLGRDCPDENRACHDGFEGCIDIMWDDEGCKYSRAPWHDFNNIPACMNFCVDDDDDLACDDSSIRLDIEEGESYPTWYLEQASRYYNWMKRSVLESYYVMSDHPDCDIMAVDSSCCRTDCCYAHGTPFDAEMGYMGDTCSFPCPSCEARSFVISNDPTCEVIADDSECCVEDCCAPGDEFCGDLPNCVMCVTSEDQSTYQSFNDYIKPGISWDTLTSEYAAWDSAREWIDRGQFLLDNDDQPIWDCDDSSDRISPYLREERLAVCELVNDDCDSEVDECEDLIVSDICDERVLRFMEDTVISADRLYRLLSELDLGESAISAVEADVGIYPTLPSVLRRLHGLGWFTADELLERAREDFDYSENELISMAYYAGLFPGGIAGIPEDIINEAFADCRSVKESSCIYFEPFHGCNAMDSDGDGFMNASFGCPLCTDCDDTNPDIYPGALDEDGTSIDMNCNGISGETLDTDLDGIPNIFEGDGCEGQGTLSGPIDAIGCWFSTGNGNLAELGWS